MAETQPPRVLLDACVLYPSVMREVLLAVAQAGLFRPLWSARLLEEWARAAAKRSPVDEMQARGEIALLRAAWPKAEIAAQEGLEHRLWLPDPNDIHVLASAIAGSADAIITNNAKDFPRHILAEEGLWRQDPDQFLMALWGAAPETVAQAVAPVYAEARRLGQAPDTLRGLLKKARLPRLGKALA